MGKEEKLKYVPPLIEKAIVKISPLMEVSTQNIQFPTGQGVVDWDAEPEETPIEGNVASGTNNEVEFWF